MQRRDAARRGGNHSDTGHAILDLLRVLNLKRRLTVIMVTHDTFAAGYGDRTVELRDGRIVFEARTPAHQPVHLAPVR